MKTDEIGVYYNSKYDIIGEGVYTTLNTNRLEFFLVIEELRDESLRCARLDNWLMDWEYLGKL